MLKNKRKQNLSALLKLIMGYTGLDREDPPEQLKPLPASCFPASQEQLKLVPSTVSLQWLSQGAPSHISRSEEKKNNTIPLNISAVARSWDVIVLKGTNKVSIV